MRKAVRVTEQVLLTLSVALLVLLYIYVHGFGKIRGPLARLAFYERGIISEEELRVREQEASLSPGDHPALGEQKNLKFVEPEAENQD